MTPRLQQFHHHFSKRHELIIESIEKLAAIETPTSDRKRLDAFAWIYEEVLRPLCDSIEMIDRPAGAVVRAIRGNGERRVLVLLHMDTVWPVESDQKPPLRRERNILRGPGVFDMKCNLVMAAEALHAMKEMGYGGDRTFEILATPDEESGSDASRSIIEEAARRSSVALVPETPLAGGHIKYRRKGVGRFLIEVRGRAAHAGVNPNEGVNAVHELAARVGDVADCANANLGTTVAVTKIGGGIADNAIPAKAWASVDVRAASSEEMERVVKAIQSLRPELPGAEIIVSGGANRPPLNPVEGSEELADCYIGIAAELGLKLEKRSTGGGSDGSFTAALGVPTLDGIGIDGTGAHTSEEQIALDAIVPRCAAFAELCLRA